MRTSWTRSDHTFVNDTLLHVGECHCQGDNVRCRTTIWPIGFWREWQVAVGCMIVGFNQNVAIGYCSHAHVNQYTKKRWSHRRKKNTEYTFSTWGGRYRRNFNILCHLAIESPPLIKKRHCNWSADVQWRHSPWGFSRRTRRIHAEQCRWLRLLAIFIKHLEGYEGWLWKSLITN